MKMKCQERRCEWVGDKAEMLTAPDPFNEGEILRVCPMCKTLESSVLTACVEPGCNRIATSGTPTPSGYKTTCGDHIPPC